ncbi:PIG-U-domain-containing protein [Sistotremastrum suecicum HHB10207 ss-3]|uniref:PIG-U-domain-containing protein n=1 Tax=Sistotremastrum suecicum HHB10207 ss-3 TaxID=1314776 RepID=A0A166IBV8_9AGAM|nr:PIG-U-domain-containing protein [Sistotremastrum suecicum HHB10207 ss-3]
MFLRRLGLGTLIAARLLLAYHPALLHLQDDAQLSSPLTSYKRLLEGIFLFQNGVDPYTGGTFRHSPLLLALFSTAFPLSSTTAPIIWLAFDLLGAVSLAKIYHSRTQARDRNRNFVLVAFYLLNPYQLLPSLARSTASIENALSLLASAFACSGKSSYALLALAFLTHLSMPAVLLTLPISLLILRGPHSSLATPTAFHSWSKLIPLIAEYSIYVGILSITASSIAGGVHWSYKTWGAFLTLPDLTPNPGLWWYFFTEMFDHFRPFFLATFSIHMAIYVVPLSLKFQHDPLFAAYIILGIVGLLKPYPTLADAGLFLTLLGVFPEIYQYLRTPIVTALLHLHSSLLLPLFHKLWLSQGTGNANFFYASTLVFALANGFAILDALQAGLRVGLGTRPDGWELVQI